MRRSIAGLIALLGFAAAAWWWHGRTPRWNVVLITLDTTRADHLGCFGDESAATPNLDVLADDSLLFEHAYTVVPITLPAHATLLSGLLPPEHGLRINGASRLPDSVPTLAEMLSEQGYRTGAFVSSLVLDSRFGLDRGFATYNDALENRLDGPRAERPGAETVSTAIAWLNEAAAEPMFCWVHLYDPHEPYDAHTDEFGDRFVDAPYSGEIAYMDRQIGRLLAALEQLKIDEQTIVIVAGDHGEGLGEHQESTHGYLTYNSTLHVPLMIRYPTLGGGMRVADPVSLVDVFPTILDALQFPAPTGHSGRSLLPFTQQQALNLRPCYAETEAPLMEGGWSPLRTWITDRWKFTQTTRPELYDVQADPHETVNLIDEHGDEVALLQQELADFESALVVREAVGVASSEEQLKTLRGLGYAGGQAPARKSAAPLLDIKEMLPYAEQVHRSMHLIDLHDVQEAQRILEDVVAAAPDYPKAWGTLGVCMAVQQQFDVAEQHYRKALDLDAHQNFARIGLGRALFETGRLDECAEQLQSAVAVEPAALDAQFYLGEACRRLQRWDAARTAFTAAIEISPEFSEGRRGLADLDRETGRLEQAADGYRRVLMLDPLATEAALNRARVLSQLGRDGEAIETLNQLRQVAPPHVEAIAELALLLATTENSALRDPVQSRALAEQACRLSDRRSVPALRALAAAEAAAGQMEQAIAAAEAALSLAQATGDNPATDETEAELAEYRERAAAAGN